MNREDWSRILRALSMDHGMRPQDVANLTREQIMMLACERPKKLLTSCADNLPRPDNGRHG